MKLWSEMGKEDSPQLLGFPLAGTSFLICEMESLARGRKRLTRQSQDFLGLRMCAGTRCGGKHSQNCKMRLLSSKAE